MGLLVLHLLFQSVFSILETLPLEEIESVHQRLVGERGVGVGLVRAAVQTDLDALQLLQLLFVGGYVFAELLVLREKLLNLLDGVSLNCVGQVFLQLTKPSVEGLEDNNKCVLLLLPWIHLPKPF